jgi:hypothetical protein
MTPGDTWRRLAVEIDDGSTLFLEPETRRIRRTP